MAEPVNEIKVPVLPAVLGYAGLLPFLFLGIGLWLVPGHWQELFKNALLGYGVVILSFMGAVHWGLAMPRIPAQASWQLGLSVVPPLLAWLALFMPGVMGFSILIASFGILCVTDAYATQKQLAPSWYPRLRKPLTMMVMASLLIGVLGSIK